MSKAFLSHSSKDKPLIEKIAKQLGRNNCHYDSLTFEAGMLTLDEILQGLDDSDVFVLFISEAALNSPWVQKEIIEAKIRLDKRHIDRIFPLIIDTTVSHSDSRIPDWIRKPYNIRLFDNEVLILKKIKQMLRESNFKKYSHLRQINDLYYGRHEINQEFERKVINIDNIKPTCIIASSYFDGIGRRTFLKNGLRNTGVIDKWYDPVVISISARESIEDFLYKLNFVESTPDIFEFDFSKENISVKVELAVKYVTKFKNNGEILFLIDDGSIVLPNHTIVDWFVKLLSAPDLKNEISICVVSKFRPYAPFVRKLGNVLNFQVHELSGPDTQVFFLQYLKLIGQELTPNDTRFFLKYLKGIPAQIIYAASLIESMGVAEAQTYVNDIEEFDELRALSILDFLKDDNLAKQILIALSRFEVISYGLVNRIFGESQDVAKAIQKLFDLSLFFSISSTNEYLKMNTSIADYITRSKIQLDKQYSDEIKDIAKNAIQKPLELNENTDYSEFLFTLRQMIIENKPIPSKFLIPSFILKSMEQEYNAQHYKTVIELASKLLENEDKFDYQIIRETKYLLCQAYCRRIDSTFFDIIGFFKDERNRTLTDYYFLLGFYFRNDDDMYNAEKNFLEVLAIDSNHHRSKRELVNVYLRKGEYMKALTWASENYSDRKTNIYHIQAYFTCLIKKENLEDGDFDTIKELLEKAEKSLDRKADDIYREMLAEYEYYLRHDVSSAVETLRQSLRLNSSNDYAFRALLEIYKRENMHTEYESLLESYESH